MSNKKPSILERFKLHTTLMDAMKKCQQIRTLIAKRELNIEKLKKKLKES